MILKTDLKNQLTITTVLAHYNVKKGKSKDSWHCPLHNDKNPSMVANDSSGVATCLSQRCFDGSDIFDFIIKMENCNFKESIKIAANLAGISINDETSKYKNLEEIPPLKSLLKDHKKFLEKRGILNIDAIIKLYRLKCWKNYISTELSNTASNRTVKLIPIKKKLNPLYLGKNRIGQTYQVLDAKSTTTSILVVAGEKDVWKTHDSLLTEMQNRPDSTLSNFSIISSTSGENSMPKNFFNDFLNKQIEKIYICYDCDETGKKGNIKIYKLAKSVFPKADIKILQFEKNKPKGYDLTDFLNENNTFSDIFTKLKHSEPADEKPKSQYFDDPDIYFSAGDLMGTPPPIEWIVENFLPKRIVGTITATGSTGKSFFLLQLGVCVATGYNFLDMNTAQEQVLYLIGEESKADIHRRLYDIKQYYSKKFKNFYLKEKLLNEKLHFLCINGKNAILEKNANFFNELTDYIDRVQPKLIMLDPTIRFLKGDENNSQDVTRFIELMEDIKNRGITVLFAHHTNKYGAGDLSQHSSRGSSAFVDGARWQLVLTKLLKKEDYTYEDGEHIEKKDYWKYVLAEITKNNGFRPISETFSFERKKGGVLALFQPIINI